LTNSARATDLLFESDGAIDVAVETNGKGFMGFLVDLPGAFVRGEREAEMLSKVVPEAQSYLRWLGAPHADLSGGRVVERHSCGLMVEDADGEVLLKADRSRVTGEKFQHLAEIARHSGETFVRLYHSSELKDWVDASRVRKTFYGDTPKTIQEIFDHVNGAQYYYLSRTGLPFDRREKDFVKTRRFCLERIGDLFRTNGNSVVYEVDGESWTLLKLLRRFIWHDRIHGKAITRILSRQVRLGLIGRYEDAFRFGIEG